MNGAGDAPRAVDGTRAPVNTIATAVDLFLTAKESEGVGQSQMSTLTCQLAKFQKFMEGRGKLFPADIMAQDVIEYRSTWTWGDLTKIKAQTNLRSFLRSCLRGEHRTDVLDSLKTIKQTKEGIARRKPRPFTEAELKSLLDHIPDPKLQTMVRLMASTGLAIIDAVQLERSQIADGWLRISRQKTGKAVLQKLDPALHRELMSVLNGNPQFVFWAGAALAETEGKRLREVIVEHMQATGCYIRGNVFHRSRDSAVDTWLGLGWSLTDVAAALGDTLAVTEKHYAGLASRRMEERLAKLPVRTWNVGAVGEKTTAR